MAAVAAGNMSEVEQQRRSARSHERAYSSGLWVVETFGVGVGEGRLPGASTGQHVQLPDIQNMMQMFCVRRDVCQEDMLLPKTLASTCSIYAC
eukprot:6458850-Amphidinium_carterae.1